MVQNFEFKDGYWVYKLKTPVGRSKMTNWLHISPVLEESMDTHIFFPISNKWHLRAENLLTLEKID